MSEDYVLHYHSETCLIVDKPSGLLSVPGRGEDKQDCMVRRVMADFPDALIVHRLDMATSGLLLLARGKEAHRAYSLLFQERQMHKRYEAVVAGVIAQDDGQIDLPMITDWPNRPKQKVDFEIGKPSLTHYRVLARDEVQANTRVALFPHTGRSHQLRVHLQAIGHPILGDALYADELALARSPRLLLHACELAFTDPFSGESLCIESPVPF